MAHGSHLMGRDSRARRDLKRGQKVGADKEAIVIGEVQLLFLVASRSRFDQWRKWFLDRRVPDRL